MLALSVESLSHSTSTDAGNTGFFFVVVALKRLQPLEKRWQTTMRETYKTTQDRWQVTGCKSPHIQRLQRTDYCGMRYSFMLII